MRPKWVQALYNVFGSKLQGWYDEIKHWELPKEVDEMFDNLWAAVTPDIKKGLIGMIEVIYKKFGQEKAKEMLTKVIEYLSKIFVMPGVKKDN